jgi:hypothetical protein
VIEFRTADGDAGDLDSADRGFIRHLQELMPYGLFVPDVPSSS